jgi:hypothetical protein
MFRPYEIIIRLLDNFSEAYFTTYNTLHFSYVSLKLLIYFLYIKTNIFLKSK